MDKQLGSFLDKLNWEDISINGDVLQTIISYDDFCKYIFYHGRIFVGDRVLDVKCNGFSNSLGLTYTLTLHYSCYFCFFS